MQVEQSYFTMPVELIIQEIQTQISGGIPVQNIRNNYLDIFKKGIDARAISAPDDQDELGGFDIKDIIEQETDAVYSSVVSNLKNKCGIMLDISGMGLDTQTIDVLYDLFVVRFHAMIISYVSKYLMNNRSELAAQYMNDSQMSNMSFKAAKRDLKNKVDWITIVYLSNMISTIISSTDLMNPEKMISSLYEYWPDDYLYSIVFNLFNVSCLSFDIPKFTEYVNLLYSDPITLSSLLLSVSEKLIPTFKLKEE